MTTTTPAINDLDQIHNEGSTSHSEDNYKELLESADRLASKIRHDVRSPLSAIKNAVYFIRKNPQMTEQMLDSIDKNVDKALTMLEELKPLTRNIPPKRVPVSITKLIDDALSEVQLPSNIVVQ